ncbi:MAG: ABC transporter permease [Clostridia bacterium]|nr:ABC transporter permease [Clostridia bacterium]
MMMFFNSVRLAMRSVTKNKMRSFLTMLGIIIGVMSVVMLMSIAQSATGSITGAIASMGAELLTVSITEEDIALTEDDLSPLKEHESVSGVAPYLTVSGTVRSGSSYLNVSATGVTDTYLDVADLKLQSGRSVVPSDLEWNTKVAVIGTEIAGTLYQSYDVIGKTFTMSNTIFTVVGLLTESGSDSGGSLDSRVLIPLTTAQHISDNTDITTFYVKAVSADAVAEVKTYTEQLMYSLTGDEDAYSVYDQSQLQSTLDSVTGTMSLLYGGIAAISLLVGGIGIMNIMLVSVAERTREIGIRKAIGAKRKHIMMQFLTEACVLSVIGCLIGLGLSVVGLRVYSLIAKTETEIYSIAATASLAFCSVIGIAFGGYPAAKAAAMTPIDALQRR